MKETSFGLQGTEEQRLSSSSLPLVSIVTPAYNEEKCLSECIESVRAQTYPNWDYTIVDNCSTDGTRAIASKYAAMDPRIRVISNSRLVPAVCNFNLALRQISTDSKYCKMVLADDFIFPDCLERMVGIMEAHSSVGIVGAYGLIGRWVVWTGLPYPSNLVPGREVCKQRLLGGPNVFGSQTSILLRSDLVRKNNPFYNESSQHADIEACLTLLKECDFGFVHQILTFSRERPQSMLGRNRELNTLAASLLHELAVFGPYYLEADEYARRFEGAVSDYYDFLARSVLQRRRREFWQYHEGELKKNGVGFSRARLTGAVLKLLASSMLRRLRPAQNGRPWGLDDTGTSEVSK